MEFKPIEVIVEEDEEVDVKIDGDETGDGFQPPTDCTSQKTHHHDYSKSKQTKTKKTQTLVLKALFFCKTCNYKTFHRDKMDSHKCTDYKQPKLETAARKPNKTFKCELCSYTTNKLANIKLHLIMRNRQHLLKCNVCSFRAQHYSDLVLHREMHQSTQLSCNFCPFKTYNKQLLQLHKKRHTRLPKG